MRDASHTHLRYGVLGSKGGTVDVMNESSPLDVALGHELKSWRQRRGYTVKRLAELSGISKATIERIENASNSSAYTKLWILADTLDINLSDVVRRAEDAVALSATAQPFSGRARDVDPHVPVASGASDPQSPEHPTREGRG